jgi:mitotic spindle assembly checkpoint protein MAD2
MAKTATASSSELGLGLGLPEALAQVPTPAKAGRSADVITLRGSTDTVVEFFGFAINSILYQRGVYPAESFAQVSKYGLKILVTQDKGLQAYIGEVLEQIKGWMMSSQVKKLVIVVASQISGETLERWTFDVQVNEEAVSAGQVQQTQAELVRQQKDIQAIIRQITASVTFLPLLDEPCSFDLLIYTDKLAEVPDAWDESDPKYIVGGSQEVKLRSFTTKVHKVEGAVSYKHEG